MPDWLAAALTASPSPPASPKCPKVDYEQTTRSCVSSRTPASQYAPNTFFKEQDPGPPLKVHDREYDAPGLGKHFEREVVRPKSRRSLAQDRPLNSKAQPHENVAMRMPVANGIFARPASTSLAAKRTVPSSRRFQIDSGSDVFGDLIPIPSRTPSQAQPMSTPVGQPVQHHPEQPAVLPFSSPFRRHAPPSTRSAVTHPSIFCQLPTIYEDDERMSMMSSSAKSWRAGAAATEHQAGNAGDPYDDAASRTLQLAGAARGQWDNGPHTMEGLNVNDEQQVLDIASADSRRSESGSSYSEAGKVPVRLDKLPQGQKETRHIGKEPRLSNKGSIVSFKHAPKRAGESDCPSANTKQSMQKQATAFGVKLTSTIPDPSRLITQSSIGHGRPSDTQQANLGTTATATQPDAFDDFDPIDETWDELAIQVDMHARAATNETPGGRQQPGKREPEQTRISVASTTNIWEKQAHTAHFHSMEEAIDSFSAAQTQRHANIQSEISDPQDAIEGDPYAADDLSTSTDPLAIKDTDDFGYCGFEIYEDGTGEEDA